MELFNCDIYFSHYDSAGRYILTFKSKTPVAEVPYFYAEVFDFNLAYDYSGFNIRLVKAANSHAFTITYLKACTRYMNNTSAHFNAGQSETLNPFANYGPANYWNPTGDTWRVKFD